jgi:hypothetical protein
VDAVTRNKLADRDELGRLLPGHSVKGGRKRKEIELGLLAAVTSAFTFEQVTEYMQMAMDIAVKNNSSKGIMQVLEFQAAYGIGKPISRYERVEGDPISAALEKLKEIYAQQQPTYTVIEANTDNTENAR